MQKPENGGFVWRSAPSPCGGAHTRFPLGVNAARAETGPLWQNRFFSCPLDETHLWAAVRNVERNLIHARMVRQAENYKWSSAAYHCGVARSTFLAADFPPAGVVTNWEKGLKDEDEKLFEFCLNSEDALLISVAPGNHR